MSFANLQRNAPKEPDFTCPQIDAIQARLEELRDANAKLRERGDYWEEQAEELYEKLEKLEQDHEELTRQYARAISDA